MDLENRYGYQLSEKLRTETKDYNALGEYERFVLDEGFLYDTKETLKAAFDRLKKARNGELLTKEEFAAQVQSKYKGKESDALYFTLTELVNKNVLKPSEVYLYASFGWCVEKPESVIYYQVDTDRYVVNNCGTQITEAEAIVKVCREWGFEASRLKIIGTPYYDSTDWQFIRFDCAAMTWLWANETLYRVYH